MTTLRRGSRPTLTDFYQQFAARQLWEPTTRRSVDHAIHASPFPTTRLRDITRPAMEAWVKTMAEDGLAPATIKTRVGALRAVLNRAVDDGLLPTNPCDRVRLPRVTPRGRLPLPLTMEDVDRMIATGKEPIALVLNLAARAGLRMGEIRGLQVHDINLTRGIVTVRRQVRTPHGGGWETTAPKYDSQRVIPLPDELADHLRRVLLDREPADWVIPGHNGNPIQLTTLARAWADLKHHCGVDPAARIHDARHLYASDAIASGEDIVRVQHRLGHADPITTLTTYAHALNSAREHRHA